MPLCLDQFTMSTSRLPIVGMTKVAVHSALSTDWKISAGKCLLFNKRWLSVRPTSSTLSWHSFSVGPGCYVGWDCSCVFFLYSDWLNIVFFKKLIMMDLVNMSYWPTTSLLQNHWRRIYCLFIQTLSPTLKITTSLLLPYMCLVNAALL